MKILLYISLLIAISYVTGRIVKRQACADVEKNCASYGKDVCTSYQQWAQTNCKNYCGFCHGGATVSPQCVDKVNSCSKLGSDLCSSYAEFAQINCAKTCGLCNTVPAGTCRDTIPNCSAYGKSSCSGQYATWAKTHCQKYCNLCQGVVIGQTNACLYKGQTYQEGQSWADGCEKNCTCVSAQTGYYLCQSVCPTYKNLPAGCQMVKSPGQCCAKPQCPSATGCVYKGQTYQQGQTWKDGCQYRCTCVDGSKGQYKCRGLCLNWNHNLPSVCHMNSPAPGKCCPTPNCPPNVPIKYPPGYVPE